MLYVETPAITFTSDGRLTGNGAVRVLYHEYIDCNNFELAPGTGLKKQKIIPSPLIMPTGEKLKFLSRAQVMT